jgi:putative endonuclease
MKSKYFVYIMSNEWLTLYVGMTANLQARVLQHKTRRFDGFTKRYGVDRLVYFEPCPDEATAMARERQIKGLKRARKLALIREFNPEWTDFGDSLALMKKQL